MAIEIGRSFDELQTKVKGFTDEVKKSQVEVKAIDRALKLDPANVELVKQKYQIFETQLVSTRGKGEALKQQIAHLNEVKKENGELTDRQTKQLESLEQQYRLTEIEVSKFEGALQRQNQAIAKAQFGDMQRNLKQTQQAMQNMNTVMSSTTAMMGLMGIAGDQSGDKTMQGMMKAMQGMQAVIGISSMLQSMNNKSALSFQGLATSAMMAFAAFTMVNSLLNGLPDHVRPVVAVITTLIAIVVAATVAWMAFHGTMTLGVAVPIILAAVGAGIAGIKGMMPKNAGGSAEEITAGATASTSNVSTINSSTNSGGGQFVNVQTASPQQIEEAVYNAVTRVTLETAGMDGDRPVQININGREFARAVSDDLNYENRRVSR